MFVLATVAAGVLTSILAGTANEFAKHYIGKIWDEDSDIKKLRSNLDNQLKVLELKKNVKIVDRIHSEMPRDLLDQLDNCFYEIEDIQNSPNSEEKKKTVVKFLETYIKYVHLICTETANEDQIMEAGDSNTQDYESFDELWSSRENFKSEILEELTSTTSNQFGVSIIGMSGLGKTTLARAIAREELITRTFPIIYAPPQSSISNWKNAIDQIKSTQPQCKDQRALILLDGMQWVNAEDWANFTRQCKNVLHPESKVLITTQNPRFAYGNGTRAYCLPHLLGEECFSFIYNLANGNRNLSEDDKEDIEAFKMELIDTSRGSPLLASQIGFLLAAEAEGKRLDMIKKISGPKSWELEGLKRVLLKLQPVTVLGQEPHLIRCLAYCSLFPPDHEFEQDDLVQLWMAEGFTPPSNDVIWMEKTTTGYFHKLLSYSLFQTSASPGEKPRYKLHQLFYQMALYFASSTFCQKHIGSTTSPGEISDYTRHLSLKCGDGMEVKVESLYTDSQRRLRTFLLLHQSGEKISENPTFFQKLKLLRVLDLSHTNLTKLEPKSISVLIYLHYLDLSFTPIEHLPELSNSPDLQVLKLNHCKKLKKLPTELTKLTSLISLQVNASRLAVIPPGIGKLIHLQNLEVFTVGEEEGYKITELGSLNDLSKSLRIRQIEKVMTTQEAQNAILWKKNNLERLELEWSSSASNGTAVQPPEKKPFFYRLWPRRSRLQKPMQPKETPEQVLEGLQPPKSLIELMFINYCGAEFPKWLNDTKVCGLLKYIHLKGCKSLPSVHHLRRLKTLRLERMRPVSHRTDQTFPLIETFVLSDMEEMDQWIDLAATYMPVLRNLRVEKCEKLRVLPPLDRLRTLEKLEAIWCTKLEELPTLPQSLTSLIVENNDNLKARCQTGGADRYKIRHIIEVVINSEPVDTSEPDPNSVQIAGNPFPI